ncbi:MAG: hypothetical protein KC448_13620 [Yoonia sp.]|nr:hypothetical protein [Yoonia sp.]
MAFILPPTGLLTTPSGASSPKRFSLGSGHWYSLQNHVQSVLALPYDLGEYEKRYGARSSGEFMTDSFDAMHRLRVVGTKYGSPHSLRTELLKNPGLLADNDMPDGSAYTKVMWTVNKAQNDAFRMATMLAAIPELVTGNSVESSVEGIKTVFTGRGELLDRMAETVKRFDTLLDLLENCQSELEEAQIAMAIYTDKSSTTHNDLNKQIGELGVTIDSLQEKRNAAYNKWLDLTIAAVAAAAAIAVIGIAIGIVMAPESAGASVAIGAAITAGAAAAVGGGIAKAAAAARSDYEKFSTQFNNTQGLRRLRVAYRHDLTALDAQMRFSIPSSTGLVKQFKGFRDGWQSTIDQISETVSALDKNTLRGSVWADRAQMTAAAGQWSTVNSAMTEFMQNSLMDYELIELGNAMPPDDPAMKHALSG